MMTVFFKMLGANSDGSDEKFFPDPFRHYELFHCFYTEPATSKYVRKVLLR